MHQLYQGFGNPTLAYIRAISHSLEKFHLWAVDCWESQGSCTCWCCGKSMDIIIRKKCDFQPFCKTTKWDDIPACPELNKWPDTTVSRKFLIFFLIEVIKKPFMWLLLWKIGRNKHQIVEGIWIQWLSFSCTEQGLAHFFILK